MRLKSLLLAAMTVMVIGPSSVAWSQPYDPYGRRYDDRRDYRERDYRERDYRDDRWRGGDMRRGGGGGIVCANEGGFCAFRGEAIVRYGARGVYVTRRARNGIPCNNRVFGDPIYGVGKHCIID
jgi:hypothetical protein